MFRIGIVSAAVGLLLFATAGVAEAGRGGGRGTTADPQPSITLNQDAAALDFQSPVTFTTVAGDLSGGEYPMVYVECTRDGAVLYGQLDHPDATFVLGGGSSPWWANPGAADCTAHLFAYGGKSRGYDTIRELAEPVRFSVN